MYNAQQYTMYLVHDSDPLSLRRASSPVNVACLLGDQDLFLKTMRKQIKNICRGCILLMISDRKKLKSRSSLRVSSFLKERFFSHFKFLRNVDATCSDCHFVALEPLQKLHSPTRSCLLQDLNLEAQLHNAQVRGRINNKQKKKKIQVLHIFSSKTYGQRSKKEICIFTLIFRKSICARLTQQQAC